jgi:hypothetical protein
MWWFWRFANFRQARCGTRECSAILDGVLSALELNDRKRRLLLTTNTLENAMAAPASMGFSSRRP